jgi:hypothetical protein
VVFFNLGFFFFFFFFFCRFRVSYVPATARSLARLSCLSRFSAREAAVRAALDFAKHHLD